MRSRQRQLSDDDWAMLPPRFNYLKAAAQKYGTGNVWTRGAETSVDGLDAADHQALAQVYNEVVERDDARAISDWLVEMERSGPAQFYRSIAHPLLNLLMVFELLGEKNIRPFDSRQAQYDPTPQPVDWSSLPQRLSYLIEPAEKYGVYQFDDQIARFVESVTPQQRSELVSVSERVRRQNDVDALYGWLDQHRYEPAGLLVAYMVEVLNETGLPIESE